MKQHRGALLEDAAAADRKQRVAGKKDVFVLEPISDVAGSVPRNLDDFCFERAGYDPVTLAYREVKAADLGGLLGRADDARAGIFRLQSGDALNMIDMMMGDQNIGQFPLTRGERGQARPRLGRVDRRRRTCVRIVDEHPEIILKAEEL